MRGAVVLAIVALILTAGFFSAREWIMWHVNFAIAQHRHRNLTTADFQYDFEHLMRVLEADWPFFELSVSANGVDVHQAANDFRYILAEADVDAIGFFELLREDFFHPIGVLPPHLLANPQVATAVCMETLAPLDITVAIIDNSES